MSDDEEYEVEEICEERELNGRAEYLVKWKHWPESCNTWEPEENLTDCEQMLRFKAKREYEKLMKAETGFDVGLKVKKVRGIRQILPEVLPGTEAGDRTFYIIEWEDSSRVDLVPSKTAKELAPQEVLDYWDARRRWGPRKTSVASTQTESGEGDDPEGGGSMKSSGVNGESSGGQPGSILRRGRGGGRRKLKRRLRSSAVRRNNGNKDRRV